MYGRDPKDIKQAYKVRGNIAKIGKQYELYNCLINIEDQLIAPGLPQEYAGKSQGRNGGVGYWYLKATVECLNISY